MVFVSVRNSIEIECYNTDENNKVANEQIENAIHEGYKVEEDETFLFLDKEKRSIKLVKNKIL